MAGPVRLRFFAHLPANTPVHPRKPPPKSFVKKTLPVSHTCGRTCAQIPAILMKTRNFRGGGRGYPWYGPGASLTEQTGSIPDIVQQGQRHVEAKHALESEQCDGREATVHRGV